MFKPGVFELLPELGSASVEPDPSRCVGTLRGLSRSVGPRRSVTVGPALRWRCRRWRSAMVGSVTQPGCNSLMLPSTIQSNPRLRDHGTIRGTRPMRHSILRPFAMPTLRD